MGMNRDSLHRELCALLNEVCGEDVFAAPEEDLLESGLLDSLARVEWLERLEDRFGWAPQPTQISPEVWRSAEKLISFCLEAEAQEHFPY